MPCVCTCAASELLNPSPNACLLLQAALQDNLRTARQLHERAEGIVADSVEALLEVDMDEAAAVAYLKEATPGILRWGSLSSLRGLASIPF